jgi:ribosomal protein S18 acetylase RimI-like enzyme
MDKQSSEIPSGVSIEEATIEDIEEIFDMKMTSWIETYAKGVVTEDDIRTRVMAGREKQLQNFRNMIVGHKSGDSLFPLGIIIARAEGRIVGLVTPMIFNNQNRVGSIYILKDFQKKGIGHLFMQKVVDVFKNQDIYLHVQSENTSAIEFYKKWGFFKTKDLPLEYFDKEKTKELHQIEMKRPSEDYLHATYSNGKRT